MKILIAYYSRTGGTEKVADALKKELETRGHLIDVEKIKPVKEHSFWIWWHLRMIKGECEIQPPKIVNVSQYDAILIGSPNWTRLSLPVARYLKEVKGLKYKNVGFFATTILSPAFEWFVFSAYLLDLTFSRIIEKKEGRIIDSILLSSVLKRWNFASQYGKKEIKKLCNKIETPILSYKNYVLSQKEISETRSLIVVFSTFLLFSLFLQIIFSTLGKPFFDWSQYLILFFLGLLSCLGMLILMQGKTKVFLGKYLAGFSVVAGWTLIVLFSQFPLGRPILLGYILIFIFLIFFREIKIVLFTGLVAILSYGYLFFYYPQKEMLQPSLDITLLLLGLGLIGFVTQNLQKYFISVLAAQDEIAMERATLEIKVKARTGELRELAGSLDKRVKERTKELQGRVNELERFHRLTVGRELKMIELKKEIKKLNKELEKFKGRK